MAKKVIPVSAEDYAKLKAAGLLEHSATRFVVEGKARKKPALHKTRTHITPSRAVPKQSVRARPITAAKPKAPKRVAAAPKSASARPRLAARQKPALKAQPKPRIVLVEPRLTARTRAQRKPSLKSQAPKPRLSLAKPRLAAQRKPALPLPKPKAMPAKPRIAPRTFTRLKPGRARKTVLKNPALKKAASTRKILAKQKRKTRPKHIRIAEKSLPKIKTVLPKPARAPLTKIKPQPPSSVPEPILAAVLKQLENEKLPVQPKHRVEKPLLSLITKPVVREKPFVLRRRHKTALQTKAETTQASAAKPSQTRKLDPKPETTPAVPEKQHPEPMPSSVFQTHLIEIIIFAAVLAVAVFGLSAVLF